MNRTAGRKRSRRQAVHPAGSWQRLMERWRGRDQLLIRPGRRFPLLLVTYTRGQEAEAREVESIFSHGLPLLPPHIIEPYAETLEALPAMVVVILRQNNTCDCLGHCHPKGTECGLTRRLAADLGNEVSEIDLATESIRNWSPRPISALAVGDLSGRMPALHFEAALLAVFLHELQHVAFPDRRERNIRGASDDFYLDLMQYLVSRESGAPYGMNAKPPE